MGNVQKKVGSVIRRSQADKDKPASNDGSAADADVDVVERIRKRGPISRYYTVHDNVVLGRGHYAIVNLGVNKRTQQRVAVKRIQIRKSRVESLHREVGILLKVGAHPNIVTLYDIFITDTEVQLVMELLNGGELFDRMVERGPYSELEASNQICKIAHALKFLHGKNVVHRDLKPENLILTDKGDDAQLKIADFGLSRFVEEIDNSTMKTVCGTWAYCAPEVRQRAQPTDQSQGGILPPEHQRTGGGPPPVPVASSYSAKVDMWSTGVIMYVMLSAYHPFDPDGELSDTELWRNVCRGVFDFNDPAWDHISEMAKDCIRKLVVLDPDQRYSPVDLLNHPWIKGTAEVPITPITPTIDRSLLKYRRRHNHAQQRIGPVAEASPFANAGVSIGTGVGGQIVDPRTGSPPMSTPHVHAGIQEMSVDQSTAGDVSGGEVNGDGSNANASTGALDISAQIQMNVQQQIQQQISAHLAGAASQQPAAAVDVSQEQIRQQQFMQQQQQEQLQHQQQQHNDPYGHMMIPPPVQSLSLDVSLSPGADAAALAATVAARRLAGLAQQTDGGLSGVPGMGVGGGEHAMSTGASPQLVGPEIPPEGPFSPFAEDNMNGNIEGIGSQGVQRADSVGGLGVDDMDVVMELVDNS